MVAVTRLEGFGVLVNGGAAFCAFVSICLLAPLDVPAFVRNKYGYLSPTLMVFVFLFGAGTTVLQLVLILIRTGKMKKLESYRKLLGLVTCIGCLLAGLLAFVSVVEMFDKHKVVDYFETYTTSDRANVVLRIFAWLGMGLSTCLSFYACYLAKPPTPQHQNTEVNLAAVNSAEGEA